ncbi:acyl-CoA thioesterase [Jatrophihabitans sp. DSM 45814]
MSEDIENSEPSAPGPNLLDLLALTEVGQDRYVAEHSVAAPQTGLYGGQITAQALLAAARTVTADRAAHSLHLNFLRPGDSQQRVSFEVQRERDGRSYSARRVIARQGDRVMFNMSVSFQVPEDGPDLQSVEMPAVAKPADSEPITTHLYGIEVRDPEPEANLHHPSRVWLRCQSEIGADGNRNAAAMAYVSDLYSGIPTFVDLSPNITFTSLDHSLWVHRRARMDQWVLMDLIGVSFASNRGWYTGHLYDETGVVVGGLAQEVLIRPLASSS